MKKTILFTILIASLALTGCAVKKDVEVGKDNQNKNTENTASENTQIANPASTYCIEQGGKSEIVETEAGQAGICKFGDGSECDEWAFFRKECKAGETASENTTSDITTSSEDSSDEIFNNQPGAIKSITTLDDNSWQLAVDLLSRNSKWLPGVDNSGGFFINQNTKIRNLTLTINTKTYNCGTGLADAAPYILQNTANFISNLQNSINKSGGEFGYTAYFDINGINITAIHEQCLP